MVEQQLQLVKLRMSSFSVSGQLIEAKSRLKRRRNTPVIRRLENAIKTPA